MRCRIMKRKSSDEILLEYFKSKGLVQLPIGPMEPRRRRKAATKRGRRVRQRP